MQHPGPHSRRSPGAGGCCPVSGMPQSLGASWRQIQLGMGAQKDNWRYYRSQMISAHCVVSTALCSTHVFSLLFFKFSSKELEFPAPHILISSIDKSAPKKNLIGCQNGSEIKSQPHTLNQGMGFFYFSRDMSRWKDTVLLCINEPVHGRCGGRAYVRIGRGSLVAQVGSNPVKRKSR